LAWIGGDAGFARNLKKHVLQPQTLLRDSESMFLVQGYGWNSMELNVSLYCVDEYNAFPPTEKEVQVKEIRICIAFWCNWN
jgi:hypothetical protein